MKLRRTPRPRLFGVDSGLPDVYDIELNQRELATLRRAAEIRENVRELMSDRMGREWFESSIWYTLDIDDLLDGVSWTEWDMP